MVQPIVHTSTIGEYGVNSYLVKCPKSNQAVLIDPAGDPNAFAAWVAEHDAQVKYILLTHGHPDHTTGTARLSKKLDAPVALHKDDQEFFQQSSRQRCGQQGIGHAAWKTG